MADSGYEGYPLDSLRELLLDAKFVRDCLDKGSTTAKAHWDTRIANLQLEIARRAA